MSSTNAECTESSSLSFLQRSTKRVLDAAASATRFSFSGLFSKQNQEISSNPLPQFKQEKLLEKSFDTQVFSDDFSVQESSLPIPVEWEKTPRFFYNERLSVNEMDSVRSVK
jgi:hypothetical protein